MTDVDRYRRGSLGDLIQLVIDGWEIVHLHYGDVCGDPGMEVDSAAAFVILRRPDSGLRGIYIPDDERTLSHRGLVEIFRQSPRIWKHRTADAVRQRLKEQIESESTRDRRNGTSSIRRTCRWTQPTELVDVIGLGQVETIEGVTVACSPSNATAPSPRPLSGAHRGQHEPRVARGPGRLVVDNVGRRYRSASVGVERPEAPEGVIALTPASLATSPRSPSPSAPWASGPDGHLAVGVPGRALTPGLG